jgi:glutaconate CoA-transferase subunit A
VTVDELVALIPQGALVAVPPDYSGPSLAATRALIAAARHGLRLLAVPTSGMQADLLVGAGVVDEVEAAAVMLGEHGGAPRFNTAVVAGTLRMRDSTCPAIHAALQATEKGIPFIPLRGLIGSDVLRHRPDWQVIENPFAAASADPIVLLPALRPDVALFHAPRADRDGNVFVGRRRELVTMAHSARQTLVTVEEIVEGSLLDDEATAAGVLPALYVTAIAEARAGSWPLGLPGHSDPDSAAQADYARAARSEDGFRAWVAGWLGAGAA